MTFRNPKFTLFKFVIPTLEAHTFACNRAPAELLVGIGLALGGMGMGELLQMGGGGPTHKLPPDPPKHHRRANAHIKCNSEQTKYRSSKGSLKMSRKPTTGATIYSSQLSKNGHLKFY